MMRANISFAFISTCYAFNAS